MVLLAVVAQPERGGEDLGGARRSPSTERKAPRGSLHVQRTPGNALPACGNIRGDEAIPASGGGHESLPEGRGAAGWHLHQGWLVHHIQHLCDGKDGEYMGQGLPGVPAGEVAGRRLLGQSGMPPGESIQVPGFPCRAEDLPREGYGIHSDEIDRSISPREAQDRRPESRSVSRATAVSHPEDERRAAGEGEAPEC